MFIKHLFNLLTFELYSDINDTVMDGDNKSTIPPDEIISDFEKNLHVFTIVLI